VALPAGFFDDLCRFDLIFGQFRMILLFPGGAFLKQCGYMLADDRSQEPPKAP
jgi:hypothetical protein